MRTEPAISVVIPLYNKEEHVVRAIESVLSQTFQDLELIVIDDGSTDQGADVVAGLPDPRIRMFRQENRGVSAARNLGIETSRADIVAFLDADDEWSPWFLEVIMDLRAKYPDAGIFSTAYSMQFPMVLREKTVEPWKGDRMIDYFEAFSDFGLAFNSSSVAVSRKVLLDKGGFPEDVSWCEDGYLWFKIALTHGVAYSPMPSSIYHQYSENRSAGYIPHDNPLEELLLSPEFGALDDGTRLHAFRLVKLTAESMVHMNSYWGRGKDVRRSFKEHGLDLTPRNAMMLSSTFIPRRLRVYMINKLAKTLSSAKHKTFRSRI